VVEEHDNPHSNGDFDQVMRPQADSSVAMRKTTCRAMSAPSKTCRRLPANVMMAAVITAVSADDEPLSYSMR